MLILTCHSLAELQTFEVLLGVLTETIVSSVFLVFRMCPALTILVCLGMKARWLCLASHLVSS